MNWLSVGTILAASLLPGCGQAARAAPLAAASTPLASRPPPTHPGARAESSVPLEIEAVLAVSGSRVLVAGADDRGKPYGWGLFWIDAAAGSTELAFPPAGSNAGFDRVVSTHTRSDAVDLIVGRFGDGTGGAAYGAAADAVSSPARRSLVSVDLRTGAIRTGASEGGWSATTVRGEDRYLAQNDTVHVMPLGGGPPKLAGEWVLNETRWMTWLGPVLVSTISAGNRVTTWQAGSSRRYPGFARLHPTRWQDEIVGYERSKLLAWSPRGSFRVLLPALDELWAPVVPSSRGLFALTENWLLWIDPVAGRVLGRVATEHEPERRELVPSLVGDENGVWVAHVRTPCSGMGSIGGTMRGGRSSPSPAGKCQARSSLRFVPFEELARAP